MIAEQKQLERWRCYGSSFQRSMALLGGRLTLLWLAMIIVGCVAVWLFESIWRLSRRRSHEPDVSIPMFPFVAFAAFC